MAGMEPESVDAIVTDPPYGLEFMGKEWDAPLKMPGHASGLLNGRKGVKSEGYRQMLGRMPAFQEWSESWAREAFRVLKPGGHLLAFSGTRTSHRMVCAIEDAGFEIRDSIVWLYGSGFPKSLDVGKAMDKAARAEREVVGPSRRHNSRAFGEGVGDADYGTFAGGVPMHTAPATDLARQWDGWGTALKPAHEPIVVARKPLIGTVAANVERYGTGALNVDGCRIGMADDLASSNRIGHADKNSPVHVFGPSRMHAEPSGLGRWPANVILDEDAAAMLDAAAGETKSTAQVRHNGAFKSVAKGAETARDSFGYNDSGGPSRFFYCAKASRAERNAGLEGMEERPAGVGDERPSGQSNERRKDRERGPTFAANHHPTVKPIALMRWLVRLVTPPGGLVLDPFAGSGSTGCAAVLEGVRFVGIEQDAEYAEIARRRITHWLREATVQSILSGDRDKFIVRVTV
jgi:DNA modification methylase